MRSLRLVAFALFAVLIPITGAEARQRSPADEEAYFRAVERHFVVGAIEIEILREWGLPTDEIPVVLFVAGRAGVSTEALVALRQSGRSWSDLARQYRIDAAALHVPIPDDAEAGRLQSVYDEYRSKPMGRWSEMVLSDGDILALVNVRLLAQTLGIEPKIVLARAGPSRSFVQVYADLIR